MDIDSGTQDNLESDEDIEEAIQLTPAQLISLMEEAWINEKFAPEILPHHFEVVECLLKQILYMERNLNSLENSDFTKCIYQLEVDRLRFLISSYLRTRLEKIEMYVLHILEQESQRIEQGIDLYLTEQELKFTRDFSQVLEQHFENVTSFCPGLPRQDWTQEIVRPNIHSFVFIKSKKHIEGIVIDDGKNEENDLVDLNPGSQVIISYYSVANLVEKGDVHLI